MTHTDMSEAADPRPCGACGGKIVGPTPTCVECGHRPAADLVERLEAFVSRLESDAPEMGEMIPEGEVLAYVAAELRVVIAG